MIKQLRGEYTVLKVELISYHKRAKLLSQFEKLEVIHIQRSANAEAITLAGLAASFTFAKGENLKIVVLERRLLLPFEESSECETINRIEIDA